jgi:competence protein ComEC
MRSETVAAPRLTRPVVTSFEARIDDMARLPDHAIRFTLSPATDGLPPKLRVNATAENVTAGLAIGQRIRLRARLMPALAPTLATAGVRAAE